MPDNRQNLDLAHMANAPMHYQSSYPEPPHYGVAGGPGTETKLAMLREWRRIIYRHKWLILSIVVVILPLATIQAYRAKPIYQATTTIEIRPETSSLSKAGNILFVDSSDSTKSEMIIIRSQPVIKNAVTELELDRNPRFLDVTTKRSVLEAITAIIKGSDAEKGKKRGFEAASGAGEKTGRTVDDASILNEEAERKRLAPYIQTVLDNLSVEPVRDTRLINISFRHTDPEIATAVANG
ncbi:MAG TPA: Wzz/FepE/Etk N-terminal domain-containing protein, partial [Blastocatellia bacterium]